MKPTALILAGGQSRRMRRDKRWIDVAGETLLARTIRTAREAGLAVRVLIADPGDAPRIDAEAIVDRRPGQGPLSALSDALEGIPAQWALALAVDYPQVTPEFLQALAARADGQKAVIPVSGGRPQFLCALYRSDLGESMRKAVERGVRSFQRWSHGRKEIEYWPEEHWRRDFPPETLFNWNRPGLRFVDLGRMSYQQAFARQEAAVNAIAEGSLPETVHFVEHPPTYTIGRGGDASNLLSPHDPAGNPVELIRISRGGDVTYHGPGQLVGYPHIDLRRRGRDVHRYLRDLEEALLLTARALGVEARRREGHTGLWTPQGKLASIGVGVRKWITFHGFALNVDTDLRYFSAINPCGLPDCPMTTLSRLAGRKISLESAKSAAIEAFQKVFT